MTPEQQAYKVVTDWRDALNERPPNVNKIVENYAPSPPNTVLFLGTVSTTLATTAVQIRNYFIDLMKKNPTVALCEPHGTIQISDKAFLFAGFYDFTFDTGRPVYARYSFLIREFDRIGWRIAHHHSAAQPAGFIPPCNTSP
jgi:hypothetical protein